MTQQKLCPKCGTPVVVSVGRPRANIDNLKVLGAFQATVSSERPKGSIAAAARALGLPPGTVWDRLAEIGALKRGTRAASKEAEQVRGE